MSRRFFLNDCLPEQPQGSADVAALFKDMVVSYMDLRKNESLNLNPFWATREYADNVTLCGVTLRGLLNQLKSNPTLFTYACKLVNSCLPLAYDEAQLTGDPELTNNCLFNNRDAHYLLVAQKLGMMAASLPVEKELCLDTLQLQISDSETGRKIVKDIPNWYVRNRDAITQLLTPPLPSRDEPWNRLKEMLRQRGRVVISKEFEADWNVLGAVLQRLIVQRFEDALNARLLFPANNHNMELVKSDQVDRTSKVHELRHQGQGVRVYFECDADAIYIALYGSKTIHHGKDQAADFKLAKSIVQRLRRDIQ